MKLTKIILGAAIAAATTLTVAKENTCKVVAAGPASYADQLFRMMQKHNPEFQITYRTAAYDITAIEHMAQNPEFMMIAAPMMYAKANPRPNPPIEMIRVHSTTNAAIVTGKNLGIDDLATGKLNIAIPGFGFYPHMLLLQLQQKNPQLNIVPIKARDASLLLKNGDIDMYIHNEPFIDSFSGPLGFRKLAVIRADEPSVINGITTRSLHFASIFIHRNANKFQRDNIIRCLDSVAKNPAYVADMSKIGATDRLSIGDTERDGYLQQFQAMLKQFDL